MVGLYVCLCVLLVTFVSGAGAGRSGTVGGRSPGVLLLGFTEEKHSIAIPTRKRYYRPYNESH